MPLSTCCQNCGRGRNPIHAPASNVQSTQNSWMRAFTSWRGFNMKESSAERSFRSPFYILFEEVATTCASAASLTG